ncbi:4'-phosphopantetheinyl transferase family protein [Pedobacter sp. SAFR-022]|uniref:4'-phosphopantetheinyl transferase family protein n=1 Tax=Pedobacter sp. SAFR-022 TaxID=3436861 RepID=UPI003F7D1CE6
MPVILNKIIDEHTRLAVWKIEETEEELFRGLQLKAHELDFIASLNNGKRLLHWLSTRLLLRTMLQTNDYIDSRMDDQGKPYLVNGDYQISFSHSFDYASVMISKDKQVGVDIELIKDKIQKIKNKFLKPEELSGLPEQDNTLALYICWCAKEAIYKWYGKKGLEFKQHIDIYPFVPQDAGVVRARAVLPEGEVMLEVEYFKVEADYMLGYVAATL